MQNRQSARFSGFTRQRGQRSNELVLPNCTIQCIIHSVNGIFPIAVRYPHYSVGNAIADAFTDTATPVAGRKSTVVLSRHTTGIMTGDTASSMVAGSHGVVVISRYTASIASGSNAHCGTACSECTAILSCYTASRIACS